jgi:hypothetical protein
MGRWIRCAQRRLTETGADDARVGRARLQSAGGNKKSPLEAGFSETRMLRAVERRP